MDLPLLNQRIMRGSLLLLSVNLWAAGTGLIWREHKPTAVGQETRSQFCLKAGYLPASADRNIVSKMREAGLNAVWPKVTSFRAAGDEQSAIQRIEQWATACESQELQLWPVVNFAGGQNDRDVLSDFRREVTPRGVVNRNTPCPVDERYWRAVVFPRFIALADLSRKRACLAGGVLDLEMYGADHAGYGGACACDACRAGAGSDRTEDLLDWQRREITRIARELEQAVHRVAPKFQFAAMHLEEPFPFYEGIALGLGTRDVPVVCAAERTYSVGYTPEVDETRERFRKLKAHVNYVGGLWIQEFRAEQVAPQLYALGSHGSGYWLYTLGSLAVPTEQVPQEYRVPDPQPEYWSAFREASRELDRFMASRDNYNSPLVEKFVPAEQRLTIKKRLLDPVMLEPTASAVAARSPNLDQEYSLYRYNVVFVSLKAGETLRLRWRGVPLSDTHRKDGTFKLIDPEGRYVITQPIRLGNTDELEFVAKLSGTHWLTTNMFLNACQMTVSLPQAVFWGGRHHRLKLSGQVRPLYFVVAEGQSPQLDVVTEDANSPVRVSLLNPDGVIAATQVIGGTGQIAATGAAGVWSVRVEPSQGEVIHDVSLGLSPPLAPYFSDSPA